MTEFVPPSSPWLITGASGLLGHEILSVFTSAGLPAVGQTFSRQHSGLIQADLREFNDVEMLLYGVRPAGIIHCAACREPDTCETNVRAAEELNIEPVKLLLEYIYPHIPFFFVSSDYVFRGDRPPYHEQDPTNPINVYGRTKADAEKLVLQHPAGAVIRIPVLIGQAAPSTSPGFLQQMVSLVRAGKPVEVDNHYVRYPTWTRDIARILATLSQSNFKGILHISAQDGGTRFDLTRRIAHALALPDTHLVPTLKPIQRPAPRPNNTHLAIDALEGLGQNNFSSLEQVLATAIAEGWEE